MIDNQDVILRVEGLRANFQTESGLIQALAGVDFSVRRGEVLGIVGESGCGKSVTAQCIMNMVPRPGKIAGGKVTYYRRRHGQSSSPAEEIQITDLNPRSRDMRRVRGNEIAMIFQEPMTSLDPLYTVGSHLMEAITIHRDVSKQEGREIAEDALAKVHMPEPHRVFDSYPHQLSGGQRQRVMIAIALSCNPSLLIADEPTTALDVTTQAQILELMQELRSETGMSIIFITHDLGVVAEMCNQVAVMYLGKVVEMTDVDSIFYNPKHPYTKALLRSIPRMDEESQTRLEVITGRVPDPSAVPTGCAFHPRCREFVPGTCNVHSPELINLNGNHDVRCLLYDKSYALEEAKAGF